MTPEYRAEKLASVVNLGGGGIWEINYVTAVAPAAAFLWAMLQTRQSFFKPYTPPACVSDFLLHCGAILFATTVYASAPQVLMGLLVLPAVAVLLQPSTGRTAQQPQTNAAEAAAASKKSDSSKEELDPLPVKPFITTYRGAMMIITCSSILAVDFQVFPRRFAKTESFGTSLMDLGVGSFVFAAGIVAARQQLKEQHLQISSGFLPRLNAAMRQSVPLAILGLIRLASVKSLDYVEHVSEYGVHWNFFFTLALLPPATALLQPILRFTPSYSILAFVIAIIYELILYCTPGLKAYIILSERIEGDWISQNREGLFSFIGYFAIFLAGMGTGRGALPRDPEPGPVLRFAEKDPLDEDAAWLASVLGTTEEPNQPPPKVEPPPLKPELPKIALVYIGKWAGIWFIFAGWAMWIYGPRLYVSRRMANLAYVCWVCAFNNAQLFLFCGIESVLYPNLYTAKDNTVERQRIRDATSRVMKAFNRNGLALFLLANLLTGLINMTLSTLHMGDIASMSVLGAYMGVLCAVALALDHYDVSIKL